MWRRQQKPLSEHFLIFVKIAKIMDYQIKHSGSVKIVQVTLDTFNRVQYDSMFSNASQDRPQATFPKYKISNVCNTSQSDCVLSNLPITYHHNNYKQHNDLTQLITLEAQYVTA